MKTEIRELISSLYSGSISNDEFLKIYFNNKTYDNGYILEMLKKGIKNKDGLIIEEVMVLINTRVFTSDLFLSELCQLLQMPWHTKHEDIAMMLKEIADPSTLEYLYNATEFQFDYLNYDDTYQFARKCIKAISGINNKEAIDKLRLLSNCKIPEISKYATKELHNKGLL